MGAWHPFFPQLSFFSIVVGCGLMALVFYSSRHGYDEDAPPR